MTYQDLNHGGQSIFFFGLTWIGENIFEIIGAIGVIVNIAFVVRSRIDKKRLHKAQLEKLMLEHELLKKQIGD